MALVRCEDHTPVNPGKHRYNDYALPIGDPDSAAICGTDGCEKSGRVWLRSDEVEEHNAGIRIFDVHTKTVKVRVGDKIHSESPEPLSSLQV